MNNGSEQHLVFGTGPLGLSVMRALVQAGKRVKVINRSGRAAVPQGVEIVKGDAYNRAEIAELCKGAAVVYQCAQPAYNEWVEKFLPLQASILEGAARAGAKLIVGENQYMYGEVNGPISEDCPYDAQTRKGRVRAEMSRALLDAHRAGKVRVAIARASDFYGPNVMGSLTGARMFYAAVAGKTVQTVGNVDLPHTLTYIDDFGKALATLGQRDEALGQAWHVPNAQTLTQRQFINMVFEEAGHPAKIQAMGRTMVGLLSVVIPDLRAIREMMYEFDKPYVVNQSKYVRAFGNHATPHREAIRSTVAWFRANPPHTNGKH